MLAGVKEAWEVGELLVRDRPHAREYFTNLYKCDRTRGTVICVTEKGVYS
jgi:hypothetical protein